jgi:hypothetical protein
MLKISKTQVNELAQGRQDRFRRVMLEAVREDCPARASAMTDEEILAHIDEGMRASLSYGITTEGDVATYIIIMFHLGFDFDKAVGWARDILNRKEWSGRNRIEVLRAVCEGNIPGPEGGLFFPS